MSCMLFAKMSQIGILVVLESSFASRASKSKLGP
jgi:hypothetical protein